MMRPNYVTTTVLFLLFGFLLMTVASIPFARAQDENHPPFVSNVHAQQRSGAKLVDISYDVDDPDGDLLTITVSVSDDGGNTFMVPARTFTGDIGSDIAPGTGKHIVWDAGVDVPDVYGTNYRVKVTANDGQINRQVTVETITGRDGAPMVLIPAGGFQMGDVFNEGGESEQPVHTVYLNDFYIDVYEVTNEQYARFLNVYGKNTDAAGHELVNLNPYDCLIEEAGNIYRPKPGYENHPVVRVSWYGAAAYAQFYGKRLPTEAEWEKAARGGLTGKRYPWGDEITHNDANYGGPGTKKGTWATTTTVGIYTPNGYGLYDIVGNVLEWCADEYDWGYYNRSPRSNPMGPGTVVTFRNDDFADVNIMSYRVIRGGSWEGDPEDLRVASREGEVGDGDRDIGFRCAQD